MESSPPQQHVVAETWTAELLVFGQALYHWAILPSITHHHCYYCSHQSMSKVTFMTLSIPDWLISCPSVQTMTVINRILLAVIGQATLWSAGNSGTLSSDTPCWAGKTVLRQVELLISRSDWPFCNVFIIPS